MRFGLVLYAVLHEMRMWRRQSQWNALVRGMVGVNLPESFDVAVSQIVDFLTPFIENNPPSNKMWIAQKRRWMDSVS